MNAIKQVVYDKGRMVKAKADFHYMRDKGLNGLEWLIHDMKADEQDLRCLRHYQSSMKQKNIDMLTMLLDAFSLEQSAFLDKYRVSYMHAVYAARIHLKQLHTYYYDIYFNATYFYFKNQEEKSC